MDTRTCRECGATLAATNASGLCRSHSMKALNADPEFAERHRERNRERMKALHADPSHNPLVLLTTEQRADYDLLVRKGGFDRSAALEAIGRGDLNQKALAVHGQPARTHQQSHSAPHRYGMGVR